ncbi:hypothetical protein F4781DRAFT_140175 [Annulohypoxylon bovei var. microspora]|nr:hypothetical protein F4781DRAFT_140175 [Annulohypoxylon bovei var. microspora]
MCFTEYLGYTCGHTSIPVERPCPMTTQAHTNQICPKPAARPLLAATMCPACARILHGRWVNIIVHEHQFMHARGACSCDVRFPHMQQPRVVSHYADNEADAGREAVATNVPEKNTGQELNPAASSLPAITLPPIMKQDHAEAAPSLAEQFNFSPSAEVFTPSTSHGRQTGRLPSIAEIFGTPFDFGESDVGRSTSETRSLPALDKSKGKQVARNNALSDRSHYPHHYNHSNFHPLEYTGGDASSAAEAATPGAPALPSMFEMKEGADNKLEVSTRLSSQYGAEWVNDHSERHRTGECDCNVSFDKYPAQYASWLEEAGMEDLGGYSNNAFLTHSPNDFSSRQQESENMLFDIPVSRGGDSMMHDTLASFEESFMPVPTNTPAEAPTQNPAPFPAGFLDEFNETLRQHLPPAPAPAHNPFDLWGLAPDGSASSFANPPQPSAYGQPARWACSAQDTSFMNDTQASSGAMLTPRPVDMQVIAYHVQETPIVGLPIGAGPEGDSHMPPFEDCELYYPKIPGDRRPASH